MKILITGASGFIGSHLTNYLCSQGHAVTAFCRRPEKIALLKKKYPANTQLRLERGLLEDRAGLAQLLKAQDVLIHCALGWGETPVEMLVRDTLPSVALFEDAINQDVQKIIYTSSAVATGEYRLSMDQNSVCLPIDAYSATKAATENYLMALSRDSKTQCNIVRPTYTFGNPVVKGATCQPDQKIVEMIKRAAHHQSLQLIEHDGVQMIWVGTLVKIYETLLHENITRSIIIAGSEQQIKWTQVAQKVIEKLQSDSVIELKHLGWSEAGCLWSTELFRRSLGEDQHLLEKLDEHIDYLCAEHSQHHIHSGVEA